MKLTNTKRKLIVAGVLLVAIIPLAWWLFQCHGPNAVYAEIGRFESKDAGLRAAIPELAHELRVCPFSEVYRIVWIGPDPDENQGVNNRALLYDRGRRRLGYEHDVESGIAGRAYLVDYEAIRAVAEKGGTLEDFGEYDQSR